MSQKLPKVGRTYDDFKEFISEQNINHYVEMDTVIGEVGGKLIMTLYLPFDFMFGLLLNDKTAAEAASKMTALKNNLSSCRLLLRRNFPCYTD